MRQAAVVLCATAMSALILTASPARATVDFDGPQAFGATAAAGLLAGMACWTVELAAAGPLGMSLEAELGDLGIEDDFDRSGWFLGAGATYAVAMLDDDEEDSIRESHAPLQVDLDLSKHTGGLNFTAGRRCHPRFSVEVEVEWIEDFDGKLTTDSQGKVANISFAPVLTSVNLKGYLLTGRTQPYLLFGVGALSIETETRASRLEAKTTGLLALRFGAGIDYYATRNWVVTTGVDYVYSATSIDVLDYISVGVGVQYRF